MFDSLSDRFESIFTRMRGRGRLGDKEIDEIAREIRLALLEADVNFKVVKDVVGRIREKAIGAEILQSLTAGQQIVKIVHDEIVKLLGSEHRALRIAETAPTVILLVGLQGSGKTTAAAKLASQLKSRGMKPLLAACDLQRPAAIEQLKQLAAQIGVDVEAGEPNGDPIPVAKRALERAKAEGYAALIVDSAGRLHVDEELMDQARAIREAVDPTETLLVLDAMTGQDAVQAAAAFGDALEPTGSILTKLDGDARGGAALSLVETTGVPILYAGVGERIDDLEPFHPDRMAGRILGMGDILSLVEKAEAQLEEEAAERLERRMLQNQFDLDDFLEQLRMIKRMGPLQNVLGMLPKLPGIGKIPDEAIDEGALVKTEAIIQSMTSQERRKPQLIDGSRRARIANGSGTKPQDVSQLVKQFDMMRKMMKQQLGGIAGRVIGRGSNKKARKALPKMKGF